MKYSVLVLDLDGTTVPMVPNFGGMIRPKVKQAVQSLIARGVHVSIATGRSLNTALPLLEELTIQDPCIFSDGAMIYDPKKKIFIEQRFLSIEIIHTIFSLLKDQMTDLMVQTIDGEELYHEKIPRDKIFALFLHCASLEVAERTRTLFQHETSLSMTILTKTWTGKPVLHINDVRATKQVAIAHLIKYYDVPVEEVVAVGDGENDIPMILAAGTGVAMGNASDALKSVADYVAPSADEDGVAHVIEKYFPAP